MKNQLIGIMKTRLLIKVIVAALVVLVNAGCNKDDAPAISSARLESLIVEANGISSEATEGPEPGLYPEGSVSVLQAVVDSAKILQKNATSQFGIDLAEILLQNAITQFKGSIQMEKQLYFDGTGYLNGGLATAYNTPNITLEAWIYPTEWKNAMYIISTEGTQTGYKLQCPAGKPTFQIGVNGASVVSLAAATAISLNQWTHVAASFDGSKMRLYVNGVSAGQKDLVYQITDNGENFRIGEGSKFTSRTFKGRIRDVRIWDHALPDADIAGSMTNKLTGTEQGLTAWWPFNLSAGTTVFDRTGKHSVTLVNMQYVDPI